VEWSENGDCTRKQRDQKTRKQGDRGRLVVAVCTVAVPLPRGPKQRVHVQITDLNNEVQALQRHREICTQKLK
jgi:hypothetical protein